jgi:hypothetical protein
MERQAVVAGSFYPADAKALRAFLDDAIPQGPEKPRPALAVVLPHAGYMYSGAVAGKTIAAVAVPPLVIVLGPNHTGQGQPFSIMARGGWQTPLGRVNVSAPVAEALLAESPLIVSDISAHMYEHSIEVEIPFLQYCRPDLSMVPMVIADFQVAHYRAVGEAIARVIKTTNTPVLVVASSDLSHYVPQQVAERKDKRVIDAIVALDPEGMMRIVQDERVSMCGFAPVAVALFAARAL